MVGLFFGIYKMYKFQKKTI
ncbi:hypothetical protein [Lacinutrix sp.]